MPTQLPKKKSNVKKKSYLYTLTFTNIQKNLQKFLKKKTLKLFTQLDIR